MPQINRIRVNNVKYNFGTQFYDDFMMRFNCSNTLYDLANGGGKSLLMLLLMQTTIPNCTLDDKQPIEKLFRAGGGNTVIHSLVEWKLDACYQKDNYKYMTTGFCARKARAGEDGSLDETGEIEDARNARENSSIEYFNYVIFYREFNDNDIKNLPLSSNGERITYNGLKSYLRNLEKNDFGVCVKIFERKGDYQAFLTKYGIFESQWEIVRGINKTEGHVRTYFETNYRTSRKVVEDLLIEEIIQKSFNNRLGVDNDEGTMARTLLDIKDKLLELSKKHAQISSYDNQISAIEDFASYVLSFKEVYDKKSSYEKQLFELLLACKYEVLAQEKDQKGLEELIERSYAELDNENRQIMTAEVVSQENSLKALENLINSSRIALESKDREIEALLNKLKLQESVNDYADYANYENAALQIKVALDNNMRDNSELVEELKAIACIYHTNMQEKKAVFEEKCSLYDNKIRECKQTNKELNDRYEKCIKEHASNVSMENLARTQIKALDEKNAVLMSQAGLLVSENAVELLGEAKEELVADKKNYVAKSEKLENLKEELNKDTQRLSGLLIHNELLEEELKKIDDNATGSIKEAQRFESISRVYGASAGKELAQTVFKLYKKMENECQEVTANIEELNTFVKNAIEGTYVCKDPVRDKLAQYLINNYGDDVEEGHEWFRKLNNGQKRDILKRTPFVEYGFIIKNDFERIKEDVNLSNFARGAFCVPIISENILYDTKLEVNKDLVTFALKDMSFLREDARLEIELAAAREEIAALEHKLEKMTDRTDVVFDDYNFIIGYMATQSAGSLVDRKEIENNIEANNKEYSLLEERMLSVKKNIDELQRECAGEEKELAEKEARIIILEKIIELSNEIQEWYEKLNNATQNLAFLDKEIVSVTEELSVAKDSLNQAIEAYELFSEKKEKLIKDWEDNYSVFYDEKDSSKTTYSQLADLSVEQLESRFEGLKNALNKDSTDMSDKQELGNQYKISMDKCRKAIEYRGSDFEQIKSMYESGEATVSQAAQLYEIKAQIKNLEDMTRSDRDELDAQSALMNRLEGSIAHSISLIEEKYGEYVSYAYENPDNFVIQHKALIKKLKDNIKDTQNKLDKRVKNLKEIYIIEKDLERIVTNANMSIPVVTNENEMTESGIDSQKLLNYEQIAKDYEKLLKLIYKKTDEFNKHKDKLTECLTRYDAAELAGQIRISLKVPDSVEKTVELADSLRQTNEFIVLEKSRISKGIEDMEKIKDNFENRCIQTCSNIKTELDRLPKLSTITMDGELISIIGLMIPYVKEDSYKERMSNYIDETIMMAESFKSVEERLKYIRNRLTWKKLFSVIVTDMNGIRINLYKRERIKDQSRYLRYEEAVGSTGQSQGIYIQFLIAIINYISSINAAANDASVIGKTIFIDNPFGAAKDIYIWEPIFKLLKTNHVQLIVPARGATPAIAGRFDVNYVLGQKLVDKRQQTVVVDYYSKTNQAGMEYTRMDYEQATFNFI